MFKDIPGGKTISLPCGSCVGCVAERSRQWAVRIMHEAKMHDACSFITLTYDPEHLPKDQSLSVETCQLFLKRLRERIKPIKIKFFLCGEYGEKLERPHYHAIIFGYGFPDKVPVKRSGEFCLYESKLLSAAWGFGLAWIGEVSFDSAAYVANYSTKKIRTNRAEEAARLRGRRAEFLLMSRGGRDGNGIGHSYMRRFGNDVVNTDSVVVRGVDCRPPRYYDEYLWKQADYDFSLLMRLLALKRKRSLQADVLEEYMFPSGYVAKIAPSRNGRRLDVRERYAKAKLALKCRNLEVS